MRRHLALAAVLFAAAVIAGACSPAATPSPPPDPASVLQAAAKASYPTKLEITLGGSFTSGTTSTTLPDKMLVIDIDTAAAAGSVHLAVPASLLGAEGAATLAQLGVTGDTLSLDVLYDGKALYAKSPLLPTLMTQLSLLGGSAPLPSLTADSWAMIVDAATMQQVTQSADEAVASAVPSASPGVDEVKETFDEMGATLSLGPDATGPGGPARSVKLSFDLPKLKAYAASHASELQSSQLTSLTNLELLTSFSGEVLVDIATSRVEQVSVAAAATQDGTATSFALKVGIVEAPAGVSFAAPANAVNVPLVEILGPLLSGMFSGG